MKTYSKIKKELLQNKKVKQAYSELGHEFTLIELIIERRLEQGLTQAQLAKKIGTKQSAISRLERGTYNPSIAFLRKVAKALESELRISL